jgi:hypothetical protein
MRQRNVYKVGVVAVCLIAFVMVLTGCGAVSIEKPKIVAGAQMIEITGSCEIAVSGNTITVSGETNIMDGALLDISVVGQDGIVRQHEKITKNGDSFSVDFTMTDEIYDDSVKSVVGYMTFAPKYYGSQPDEVYQAYGDEFGLIDAGDGNYTWDSNGIIVMFASEMVPLEK